ncbi:MAG: cytochrome c oxidase subunit 3 [Panacagrimonas sp.]
MSSTSTALPPRAKHIPGEIGIWVFIGGDMIVFSLFFGVYTYYRAQDVALYAQSQAMLHIGYGAINTLLLLTSSLFVVLAVDAVRKGIRGVAPTLFALALACSGGFAAIKFIEYGEKIRAGITLTTNDFFMYYFVLTGIHFLHLIIGSGVLLYLWFLSRRPTHDRGDIAMLESGACFWHMVDLLWIALFPLLYLMK